MNVDLILDSPTWYLFLCLLFGAGFSFLLYYKSKLLNEVSVWIKYLLFTLRFVLISFLSFLLLTPLLKYITLESEKPIIIIAQDYSESIKLSEDSTGLLQFYDKLNELNQQLSEKYEVKTFSFSGKVNNGFQQHFDGKQTDIGSLFDEMQNRFINRNVGALILATDGLYNQGRNPLYSTSNFNFPIYPIALGDTTEKKDIAINKVAHNDIAFLGNKFPVQIDLSAIQTKNKTITVNIKKGNKIVFTQDINVEQQKKYSTISAMLLAENSGLQRYTVSVTTLPDEINTKNNSYDFYVEILEGRQKILILTESIHPDIAAIKQALKTNDNYEIDTKFIDEVKIQVDKYNLLIINQITTKSVLMLNKANEANVPVFLLVGAGSSIQLFNQNNFGVKISGNLKKLGETQAILNKDFSIFTTDKQLSSLLNQLPPLYSPVGIYKTAGSVEMLLNQKIGSVETQNPMLYFGKNLNQKFGVLIGEGIWRWRMANYSLEKNHEKIDNIIQKTIQYLSLKEDKKRFKIDYNNQFFENEPIIMSAQFYNKVYEKINEPEVTVKITDEQGNTFDFVFGKTTEEYKLNAGSLNVGNYTFTAKTTYSGEEFTVMGEFIIKPVQLESINLKANHFLLNQLADQTNGKLIYSKDIDSLIEELSMRNDIKPVTYSKQKLVDLINLKWIFFVLLGLLSIEWFIRKRNGAY